MLSKFESSKLTERMYYIYIYVNKTLHIAVNQH